MVNAQMLAAGVRKADSRKLYPDLHQPDEAGLPLLVVENALGRAVIALQGAHVMSFQPAGKDDLLGFLAAHAAERRRTYPRRHPALPALVRAGPGR